MPNLISQKERIKLLLQYWEVGLQQQLCVPLDVATADEYRNALDLAKTGDKAGEQSIDRWESKVSGLLRNDLSSANLKKVSEYLTSQTQSQGWALASDLTRALEASDARFFYFLATHGPGGDDHADIPDKARAAEQPDAPVSGDTIEAPNSGSGDKLGESRRRDILAPSISSGYVGINWPYPDALRQHFVKAYQEILGGPFPREKRDRTSEDKVFYFYRLGLEEVKKTDLCDGAIRIADDQLRLVIRRVPARISYEEPFDEWLTYEEAYYNKGQNLIYSARGVIYGFHGGMTLLCRDERLNPKEEKAVRKKLALAHFDFRPALHPEQMDDMHRDADMLEYYIGSIAMESDFNPRKKDYFAPTAYRCLLRKAPDGTRWDDVKAQIKKTPEGKPVLEGGKPVLLPGMSATISLGKNCERRSDGTFDLQNGEAWKREEDLKYGGRTYSWRWYFNRLNINRHISDLLIACPSVYSRWPKP